MMADASDVDVRPQVLHRHHHHHRRGGQEYNRIKDNQRTLCMYVLYVQYNNTVPSPTLERVSGLAYFNSLNIVFNSLTAEGDGR